MWQDVSGISIFAIFIEYKMYLKVKDQFFYEDRRSELNKIIPNNELNKLSKINHEYNTLLEINRYKRRYLSMQYLWDNKNKISVQKYNAEIKRLYTEFLSQQKECFKKVHEVVSVNQLEVYLKQNKICSI
jgi:hypothetical protein